MSYLFLFLRRIFIVFLVGTFIFVIILTVKAVADGGDKKSLGETGETESFVNSCTLIPEKYDEKIKQPEFKNPPFAYADTIYEGKKSQKIKEYRTITFDAVQDEFYLEGDKNESAYDGYLYKTTFFDNNKPPKRKTIVKDDKQDEDSLPGNIKVVDYDPNNPPDNMVGTYTPPTIVVSPSNQQGQRPNSIHLNLTNDLPVNVQLAGDLPRTKENLENQSQYTNIHYHGFNVSPLLGADDVLVDVPSNKTPPSLNNGGYYPDETPDNPKYGSPITEYKMDVKIPYVHQSGLFWYHSHAHSFSDNQVRGGLSGGIIIKGSDEYYEILSPLEKKGIHAYQNKPTIAKEPEEFSVRQKVMMFKDFNDVLNPGNKPDCFTLNGQLNPKITIQPGEVQLWRMGNIGADEYMNIALEEAATDKPAKFANPNNKPNFYILARDGDFVEKVVPTNEVLLSPGSRVEVLVVGGKTADGNSTYNLVSDLTTNLIEGKKWVGDFQKKEKSYLLATVKVENGDSVCYKDNKGDNLGLKSDYSPENPGSSEAVCSATAGKDLYAYIEAQKPTTQTRRYYKESNPDPDVDKILPDPEELFDGYYKDDGNKIPECQRGEDFVSKYIKDKKGCITPWNLYSDPLTKKRYFYFTQKPPKFFLKGFDQEELKEKRYLKIENDQKPIIIKDVDRGRGELPPLFQELYDGNRIDKISRIGDLEEWHLVNESSDAHVFHIHQLDFVVTKVILNKDDKEKKNDYNPCDDAQKTCIYDNYKVGKYENQQEVPQPKCNIKGNKYHCPLLPQGYRDVVNLPPYSETIVRIPFVNPFITGPFVYHCHILSHEDRGMMHNLKVVNTKGYGGKEVIPLEEMEEERS